ncbi:hypothetical protein [Actinomadura sp. WMMA1423]|uniref:hypothetical protein n=1 Tax=Actinomadura sp. WMMA1423 TaxID=2591108 RepID=UPI001146776E|nr:hypothetical protein [Actinomadura sp. WMMA1423]
MDEVDLVSPMFRVSIDQAAMMARLETPDGEVAEWWEAPNEAGGTFVYLRQITADGGDETGSTQGDSAEGRPSGVLPMVLMVEETLRRGRWFVAGHVYRPEAAAVRFAFEDGRSHEVAVQPNGYFLDLLPWPSEAQPSQFETTVLDRHGAVIENDRSALAAALSEEDEPA